MLGPGVHVKEPVPVGRPVANGLPEVASPVLHCLSFCMQLCACVGSVCWGRGGRGDRAWGSMAARAGRAWPPCCPPGGVLSTRWPGQAAGWRGGARAERRPHVDHRFGLAPRAVGGGDGGVARHEGDGVAGGADGAAVVDGDGVVLWDRYLRQGRRGGGAAG